jgi:hypothetical protein
MSSDSDGFCCPIARHACRGISRYYSWRVRRSRGVQSRDIGASRSLRLIHVHAPTQRIFKRSMRAHFTDIHSFIR